MEGAGYGVPSASNEDVPLPPETLAPLLLTKFHREGKEVVKYLRESYIAHLLHDGDDPACCYGNNMSLCIDAVDEPYQCPN